MQQHLENLVTGCSSSEMDHDKQNTALSLEDIINHDIQNIITLVNVSELEKLLIESEYHPVETKFLVKGFSEGFDIEYHGPTNRQDRSSNIPIQELGSP